MTLDQAIAAERAAFAAIGRLGEAELTATKAWIAGNCEGPRPQPDAEARRVLTDQLTMAITAREAAEKASGGQDGEAGVAPSKVEIAATGRLCGAARAA